MPQFRALMLVLIATLIACGPEDGPSRPPPPGSSTPTTPSTPVPPPPADTRPNVTGTYEVTGTMQLVLNDQSDTQSFRDMLRISNGTGSHRALQLIIGSLGCGPRGNMTGETIFSIEATSCPLPPDGDCSLSMAFDTGSGTRGQGGIQLSIQGRFLAVCGSRTASADLFIEMSGPRSGQSIPGAGREAFANPGDEVLAGGTIESAPLRAVLERIPLLHQRGLLPEGL